MKANDLLDLIGEVDDHMISEAKITRRKKHSGLTKWVAIAACLCVVIFGSYLATNKLDANQVQTWDSSYRAAQYFKFSDSDSEISSGKSIADAVIPYAESRSFSGKRNVLESNQTIPVMDTHPLFSAEARYNEDGSLFSITFFWHRRDSSGTEHYSDLSVTAGYQEVPQIEDCIYVEIDKKGNVVEPMVTVTERDGIKIVACGGERRKKTITFRNESGWYQISGSWNDSYEDVVALLDWFWEHPIDFSEFPMDAGDEYTFTDLSQMPDAFSDLLPDYKSFGFLLGESTVSIKNDIPVAVEAHFVSNVTEEQAKNGEYRIGKNGCTEIHWRIETEPDYYELEGCIGTLGNITKEQILKLIPPDNVTTQTKIRFMQKSSVVTIYATDVQEAWSLIESIK
jgi:hypothetical protein